MSDYTYDQVANAIKGFGPYRTKRTQKVALQGEPDGISGATMIAQGLREAGLQNINGGAVWDKVKQKWVEAPPEHQDGGCFQISRDHHAADLKRMPGVKAGTWAPVIAGKTAFDPGYCPRFEESLQFTLFAIHEAQAFGADHGVPDSLLGRFAIAAHNAGKGGALKGWGEGNLDKYTALGNYSSWIFRHRGLVLRFLQTHQSWQVT